MIFTPTLTNKLDISNTDVFFFCCFFFYLRGCLAAWTLIQEEGVWKVNSSANT